VAKRQFVSKRARAEQVRAKYLDRKLIKIRLVVKEKKKC